MSGSGSDRDGSGGAAAEIARLLAIMRRLRDPAAGCAWDRAQSFATIAPYTIEEAYEVADAIARGDWAGLREELGDLLLQVVYHAQMAEEQGWFDFVAVARAIGDKMVRRHPHVFGAGLPAADHHAAWEAHKAAERAAGGAAGILDDVPLGLPALTRAVKLQRRAARIGFDWPAAAPVLDKIMEEIAELRGALAAGERADAAEEMGDLLFACANLARHLDLDPEAVLRGANGKFERRFRFIEAELAAQGKQPGEADLDELEELWQRAKQAEG